jgi:hypothetical protein
LTFFDQ